MEEWGDTRSETGVVSDPTVVKWRGRKSSSVKSSEADLDSARVSKIAM